MKQNRKPLSMSFSIFLVLFMIIQTQSCDTFNQTQDFSFSLGTEFAQEVRNRCQSRYTYITDDYPLNVSVTLSGGISQTRARGTEFSNLENLTFTFTNIPVKKSFDIKISVYAGNLGDDLSLIYEGTQTGVILEKDTNNIEIAIQKLINSSYVTYSYNEGLGYYSFSYGGLGLVEGEKSFCLDKDENLYTLKFNSDDNSYTVCKDGAELASLAYSFDFAPTLMVDMATNTMYTWFMGNGLVLVEWPNLLSEGSAETYNEIGRAHV